MSKVETDTEAASLPGRGTDLRSPGKSKELTVRQENAGRKVRGKEGQS